MKAVVAAFNQEKALVGAFSVTTNLRIELFEALLEAAYLSPGFKKSFSLRPFELSVARGRRRRGRGGWGLEQGRGVAVTGVACCPRDTPAQDITRDRRHDVTRDT